MVAARGPTGVCLPISCWSLCVSVLKVLSVLQALSTLFICPLVAEHFLPLQFSTATVSVCFMSVLLPFYSSGF